MRLHDGPLTRRGWQRGAKGERRHSDAGSALEDVFYREVPLFLLLRIADERVRVVFVD